MNELKLGDKSTSRIIEVMLQIPQITDIMNAFLEAKDVKVKHEPIIEIKFKPEEK